MARSLRDIRRKMKAIKSTRQVTKAMELVAASKMRRAVANAQRLKRYAALAFALLEELAQVQPEAHPYLREKPPERILAILFSPDRGLCGSLVSQLLRLAGKYVEGLRTIPSFRSIDFVAIGKKGQQFLGRTGQNVVAAFPAFSHYPTFRDSLPIARLATQSFLEGTYDHVVLLYPDFISTLVQEPTPKVLLPFSKSDLKAMIESLLPRRHTSRQKPETGKPVKPVREYLFEPSEDAVLSTILPQLTELQVYQAILEAVASEHSARMLAMRNATDNATDLLDDLTLTYNQTRQANITAELSELSAAAAALG
jgi:F-type H+-transporting ATPase subunit gamma